MRNVIGSPARGQNFFPRKREVNKILKNIQDGANIQLAAPRRVGKTSILMYFLDNKIEGFEFVYLDTEAIYSENEFFRKILENIIKSESISKSSKIKMQLKETANSFLRKISSLKLSELDIELNDTEDLNYLDELSNLIRGLDLEKKIIIMIDEFPYTINNIITKNEGDPELAVEFLKSNRGLRHDPKFSSKVQFIYTGSIGLNTTVEQIGASATINDIMSVPVRPLNKEESCTLIKQILKSEEKTISIENIDYLLKRVEWWTPFYIKLILKEIIDLMDDMVDIKQDLINDSFNEIIDFRNNNYFEHYYSRLKTFFREKEFQFVIDILNHTAIKNTIKKSDIYDIAVKNEQEQEYKKLIHTLDYDGYLHTEDLGNSFRYNSPILKMWWKKYVCK